MRPTALLPVWGNDAFERAVSTQSTEVPTGKRGDLHQRSCALHGLSWRTSIRPRWSWSGLAWALISKSPRVNGYVGYGWHLVRPKPVSDVFPTAAATCSPRLPRVPKDCRRGWGLRPLRGAGNGATCPVVDGSWAVPRKAYIRNVRLAAWQNRFQALSPTKSSG